MQHWCFRNSQKITFFCCFLSLSLALSLIPLPLLFDHCSSLRYSIVRQAQREQVQSQVTTQHSFKSQILPLKCRYPEGQLDIEHGDAERLSACDTLKVERKVMVTVCAVL